MACRSSGLFASRHWQIIQTGVLVHGDCSVLLICKGTASAPSMHPCRHAGRTPAEKDQAELAFRRASEAYEVLSNGEHTVKLHTQKLHHQGRLSHCDCMQRPAGRPTTRLAGQGGQETPMLHRAAQQPMGPTVAATMGAPKCGQAGPTSDTGRRPMVPTVSFLPDLTRLALIGLLAWAFRSLLLPGDRCMVLIVNLLAAALIARLSKEEPCPSSWAASGRTCMQHSLCQAAVVHAYQY